MRKSAANMKAKIYRLLVVWEALKAMINCFVWYLRFLWQHNPIVVLLERQRRLYFVENYGEVMIKPRVKERVLDLFLTDKRRRERLIQWVQYRVKEQSMFDFSTCWQDGIVLCALLEYLCPGACPSYHLLTPHNRVKNCRLGLKLAHKYLRVPMDLLTPEEMAIANSSTENKIVQYIFMLKWASENVKDKWSVLHENLIVAKTGRCFVEGSGLRNGIVGLNSKFTVIVSDTIGVFDLLIEIRGPNSEFCGERIVSLHQAEGMTDTGEPSASAVRYLEDSVGNTFVKRQIPPKHSNETAIGDVLQLDVHCGEEGTFYVNYIPRRAGMHTVSIKWQNTHVESSPFRVKVYKATNLTSKGLTDAKEKRVIYDSLSFTTLDNNGDEGPPSEGTNSLTSDNGSYLGPQARSSYAIAKAKSFTKGRQLTVTRRRVLKRIITRNGEEFTIEMPVSPSLSRQSSITSDDENKTKPSNVEDNRQAAATGYASSTAPVSKPGPVSTSGFGFNSDMQESATLGTVVEEMTSSQNEDELSDRLKRCASSTTNDKESVIDIDHAVYSVKNKRMSLPNAVTITTESASYGSPVSEGSSSPLGGTNEKKQQVRRAASDTLIYQLRKRLLALSHDSKRQDETDDQSSSSSEEINNSGNKNNHALRLLQSGSLRKTCLYISKKADKTDQFREFNQSVSSESWKAGLSNEAVDSAPMPIKRRMWPVFGTQSDEDEESLPVQENIITTTCEQSSKIVESSNIERENIMATTDTLKDRNEVNKYAPSQIKVDTHTYPSYKSCGNYINTGSACTGSFVVKTYHTEMSKDPQPTSIHKTTIQTTVSPGIINKENKKTSRRGSLKRQDSICTGHALDHVPIADSEAATASLINQRETSYDEEHDSCLVSPGFNSFRSISNEHRQGNSKTSFTSEVLIIIPKPKMDKSTQVRDFEITKETGWDIYEGVYLLIRKISLKVPTFLSRASVSSYSGSVNGQKCAPKLSTFKSETRRPGKKVTTILNIPATQTIQTNRMQSETSLPVSQQSPVTASAFAESTPTSPEKEQSSSYSKVTDSLSQTSTNESHLIDDSRARISSTEDEGQQSGQGTFPQKNNTLDIPRMKYSLGVDTRNITAWFERNRRLIDKQNMDQFAHPSRQLTVDTIDSGYVDENHSRMSRQGRYSLPTLRPGNGHIPLYRRPYQGSIELDSRLIRSANTSLETLPSPRSCIATRDLLVQVDYDALAKRQNKYGDSSPIRRGMASADDTFSLSDNELNCRSPLPSSDNTGSRVFFAQSTERQCRGDFDSTVERVENSSRKRVKSKISKKGKQRPLLDGRNLSLESTDDDTVTRNTNESGSGADWYLPRDSTKPYRRPPRKQHKPRTVRGASSSLEESYCGFGIAKTDRRELMGEVGVFSNLFSDDNEEPSTSKLTETNYVIHEEGSNSETDLPRMEHRGSITGQDITGHGIEMRRAAFRRGSGTVASDETKFFDESDLQLDPTLIPSEDEFNFLDDHDPYTALCNLENHLYEMDDVQTRNEFSIEEMLDPTATNEGQENSTSGCEIAGPGLSLGWVGVKNNFHVWTEGPENGPLAVNITGPKPHSVTETSVVYTGDNLYEVTYEVTHPGNYSITVQWADKTLPECPFVARITL